MNTYSAETQVFHINPDRPESEIISRASRVLLEGGLVAFPTETVYGLGANALDESAVNRIFAAKQRPFYDPLIVHIAEKRDITLAATDIPDLAYLLAEKFWPGPLTLVLKRHERVAPSVSAGLGTAAVRMPNHPIPLDLIRAAGVPVAAPSANLFTRPSPTSAQHVLDDLGGRVDFILDGGPCPIGLESTVLDLTSEKPTILRPGGTPVEALKDILPDLVIHGSHAASENHESKPSPGMMLKHYSPKAKFLLFSGGGENATAQVQQIASQMISQGRKIGLLVTNEEFDQFSGMDAEIEVLGSGANLAAIGQTLFSRMRALDKKGAEFILMRSLPNEGLGLAIGDRLIKAAEHKVIDLDQPINLEIFF
jgi:L-threonylcarbamoyladenylate synthase